MWAAKVVCRRNVRSVTARSPAWSHCLLSLLLSPERPAPALRMCFLTRSKQGDSDVLVT